jgi:hypothetical protein
LEKLLDLLQLAFGVQNIQATAKRELLKLKMKDREFSLYYAEFQRWVPDVDWNKAAQPAVLRQGLCEELKDSLQHCDIPTDLTEFVKLCSKRDSQIRAPAAERRSGKWTAGSKRHETQNNTTSVPEVAPAGTMANYHGPAPMDLSAIKGRKITPKERKHRREGGLCMYCGNSRHFAASCPRKLNATSGQVEIKPFKEDLGKRKKNQDQGKGKEAESGKV